MARLPLSKIPSAAWATTTLLGNIRSSNRMENRGRIIDDEQGKRHSLAETQFVRRLIMASTIKEKAGDAGHAVVDAAKNVGHKIAEGAEKTVDFVKEKTGIGCPAEGTDAGIAGIKEHMDVIASCGKKVGVVDHVDDGAIRLTKKNSADGQHHFIPVGWVERVDSHVHLKKNSMETEQDWKSDAAACACSG
jgi:hypothetical protein